MIRSTPIDINKIRNNLVEIERNLKELSTFALMSTDEFMQDNKNYALAEHYLRRALEGILTIGTHLLSRLPAKTKDYQEIIVALGQQGIIPKDFAEKNKKLAGYRNRLVHVYWEVGAEELHAVIKTHLPDIEQFCSYYREVIKHPEKFNLKTE